MIRDGSELESSKMKLSLIYSITHMFPDVITLGGYFMRNKWF